MDASHLISVEIRQSDSGWFTASSADCPGLWVYGPTRDEVVGLIPEAIELIYQARFKERVKVIPLSKPSDGAPEGRPASLPFATIPESTWAGHGAA